MDDGTSYEDELLESDFDESDGDDSSDYDEMIASALDFNNSESEPEPEPDTQHETASDTEPEPDTQPETAPASEPESEPETEPDSVTPSEASTAPTAELGPTARPEETPTSSDSTTSAYVIGRSSDAARRFDSLLSQRNLAIDEEEEADFVRELAQRRFAERERLRASLQTPRADSEERVEVSDESSDHQPHHSVEIDTSGETTTQDDEVDAPLDGSESVEAEVSDDDEYEPPADYESSESHEDTLDASSHEDDVSGSNDSSKSEPSAESESESASQPELESVLESEPESTLETEVDADTEATSQPEELESVSTPESNQPQELIIESDSLSETGVHHDQHAEPVVTYDPKALSAPPGTYVLISSEDLDALKERESLTFGALPPVVPVTTLDKKFSLGPKEETASVSMPKRMIDLLSILLTEGIREYHTAGLSDDEIAELDKKLPAQAFANASKSRGALFEAWVRYIVDKATNPKLLLGYLLATTGQNIAGLTVEIDGVSDDVRRIAAYFDVVMNKSDTMELLAQSMEDMKKTVDRVRSDQIALNKTAHILERGQAYLLAESTGKAASHTGASPDGLSVMSSDAEKVFARTRRQVETRLQREKDSNGRTVPPEHRGSKSKTRN